MKKENSASAPKSSTPEQIGNAQSKLPETPGPLSVYTPSGKLVTSDKSTLHQCLADLSRKVGEVTAITVTRNKGDADAFIANYTHNRKISESNKDRLRRRMDANDWPVNGPSLAYDANGNICDGGHTNMAFKESLRATLPFIVILGTDPKLNTRNNTGMYRDLIAQAHYFKNSVLDDIESVKEQRAFVTSVSQIFAMAAEHEMWDIGLTFSEGKKEVLQHKVGTALTDLCHDHFVVVRNMLDEASKTENGDVLLYKRLIFYVPCMVLRLAGYEDYPLKLAVGDDQRDAPLTKGNRWLLGLVNRSLKNKSDDEEDATRKPEFTTRREQSDNRHTINTLLAFAYAEATKAKEIRIPLPRYKVTREGEVIDLTSGGKHGQKKRELAEDRKFQYDVAEFFLRKIKSPTVKG